MITVTVQQEVSMKSIRNMLTSAFEGGSNYWCNEIVKVNLPNGATEKDFKKGGKFADKDDEFNGLKELVPTTPGGSLILNVDNPNDEPSEIDMELGYEQIVKGIQIMASKYTRHFSDMMTDNDDADTADVFLQCCLFGEIVYG